MSDKVLGHVGKYLKLSAANAVVGTNKGEVFMCIEHSVHRGGDKTKDRLDAVVFKDQSVLAKATAALKQPIRLQTHSSTSWWRTAG